MNSLHHISSPAQDEFALPAPTAGPAVAGTNHFAEKLDHRVQENPGASLLMAIGAGLALGLLIRALRREPRPEYRLARMVEDIERRVREVSSPALAKAGAFAEQGMDAVRTGARVGAKLAEGYWRKARKKIGKLFS